MTECTEKNGFTCQDCLNFNGSCPVGDQNETHFKQKFFRVIRVAESVIGRSSSESRIVWKGNSEDAFHGTIGRTGNAVSHMEKFNESGEWERVSHPR